MRKGTEKPSKMEPKTVPMRPQNSGRPRSWSVLAAKTPQDPPKTSPRPPKTPQDRPRPPPDTPRCPQDAPKTCQRPDQDAPRSHKTPKRPPRRRRRAPQERPGGVKRRPRERFSGKVKANQVKGGGFQCRGSVMVPLAWPGRLERPSRPDLT